jgi:ABC-type nickel/cobalt efflux system permease component RcnA
LVDAHPATERHHDRTIVVRLQKGQTPGQVRVRVEYRLEVLEATVYRDMVPFEIKIDPLDPFKFYDEFTRIYADEFVGHFVAEANKKPISKFRCLSRKWTLYDENGQGLGHLRCDFVFESEFTLAASAKTTFFFEEKNYYLEEGLIVLSLVNETGLALESRTEPSAALLVQQGNKTLDLADEHKLRKITAVFGPDAAPAPPETPAAEPPRLREPAGSHDDRFSLLRLLLHTDYGLWLTLLLAFFFGAAHALTPGHGKTLVAAYLVGERGTIWHALFLGLVTTLTHTGVVILLAIIMTLLPSDGQIAFQKWIQGGLGLVMGLLVVSMGFWLLLQRVSGKADHFHVGGGHHHHHHGTPVPSGSTDAPSRALSWWGLVMLGVTGGIVPCWDAIVLLFFTVGTSRFWLVLPAVLAFSAGLALVLVLIGVLVVQVPRFVEARGGDGRLLRALPTISALAVIGVGLWLCYEWSQGR